MRWGEDGRSDQYSGFFNAIKKAEAIAEARNVAVIQAAAKDSWQAAAWWLERKYSVKWGKNGRPEHTEEEHRWEIDPEPIERGIRLGRCSCGKIRYFPAIDTPTYRKRAEELNNGKAGEK